MSVNFQPRGTSLSLSRLPYRPWAPCSLRTCNVKVPRVAPTAEPPRIDVRVQAVRGSRAGGSDGRSFEPNGGWTNVTVGDDDGSLINKSISKELLRCKSVAELGDLFTANEAELNPVNVATAWMQLGKLHGSGGHGQQDACNALGKRMMGKTLALVHQMQLRQLSSTLWGMTKASFALDKHPLGAYFLEAAGQVLLSLVNENESWPDVNISMVWYALSKVSYHWDKKLLGSIARKSLEDVDSWEDPKLLAQSMAGMGYTAVALTASQKGKLVEAVTRITHNARDTREFCRALEFILSGACNLKLHLPYKTLRQLHDTALGMPVPYALELRRVNFAIVLRRACQLGFQPTPEETDLWCNRLLNDFGTNWTCKELTWTMLALSSMPGYKPPPDVLQRLRAQLLTLRNFSEE
ncbi:hypothetical protein Agub_g2218, partial [Astrephomene gubernaculifera]